MVSNFEQLFPKPTVGGTLSLALWEQRKDGYLAALEIMHAKISQVVSLDSVALHIIEQEIEAIEKEDK